MPSLEDLSRIYADRIVAALRRDGFLGRVYLVEREIRDSSLLRTLKEVRGEVERLVYENTDRPLTEADKQLIIQGVGRGLGLASPSDMGRIIKAASNDDFVDMINHIESLLKGVKK